MRMWTLVVAAAVGTGCIVITDGEGAQAPIDRTVEVTGGLKLVAHNVSGRLCVTRGESGVVAIRGRAVAHGFFDDEGDEQRAADDAARNLPVDVRNGVVLVNGPDQAGDSDDSFITYDLEIAVPLGSDVEAVNVSGTTCVFGTGARVEVSSVSGDVTVRGALDVVLRSVSGDFDVQDVRTVDAETTSGDLKAASVLGDFAFTSVSGDLVARDLGDDVRVETTSGDVEVASATGTASTWDLGTISGDVALDGPDDDSFHLEYDTTSGELHGARAPFHDDDSDRVRAVVGTNPDALVSVVTVSGDLRLGRVAQ